MIILTSNVMQVKGTRERIARDRLLETFLQTEMIGRIVDAISATQALAEKWGLLVDWHEFAPLLDRVEWAVRISKSIDGHTRFLIRKEN